ncbi:MAG: uncharacterized protein QOK39_785 [Acidimicrobiaceae bacterium]|nr:uncharacterized protein [Acidimicrobiaceae bacterium]
MVAQRLVVDGRVVCDVEVAVNARARRRGLSGRDGIEGAFLVPRCPAVHTVGMRFPIEVAFLDRDLVVLEVVAMAPGRLGWPRLRARSCLEAEAGSFGGWGLQRGSRLELRSSLSEEDR